MKFINWFVLSLLTLNSSLAKASGDWANESYQYKSHDRSIKQALLDFSFNMETPIELPEEILGERPIDLPEMSALEYLKYLCRLAGATWYFDGYKLYIIKQEEIKTEILNIEDISYRKLITILKELEVYDKKFPVKYHSLESVIYVRGPSIYINNIKNVLKKYKLKENNKIKIVYGNN